MRKRILTTSNKVICFFLALLGFACSSNNSPVGDLKVAYGSPQAFYIVKGNITSTKDNTSVKGLRVIAKTTDEWFNVDTVKTDASGNYSAKISALYSQQINLRISDIDALENGTFQPLDTIITVTNPKFTGGDGHWYRGTAETVLNIKVKPKQ